MSNVIEKAKHQVGDVHPNHPNWVWTEWAPGKFDWKSNRGKHHQQQPTGGGGAPKAQQQPATQKQENKPAAGQQKQEKVAAPVQKELKDMTPDEIVNYAQNASTEALTAAVNDKKNSKDLRQIIFNELKTRDDYDKKKVDSADLSGGRSPKPTATVQYKTKKPEVEIEEPEDWTINTPQGRKKVSVSGLRKMFAGYDGMKLLAELNNTSADWRRRQIAYDEVVARGNIDENKIDVSGTLQREWDKQKRHADILAERNKPYDEASASELKYSWGSLKNEDNAEKIMKNNFSNGDLSWMDPNNSTVKKLFKTESLAGRSEYDTFKDYFQRDRSLVPGYLSAQEKVDELNGMYDEFIRYGSSPLFISAGGAGAGKTFGWREVCEDVNCKELQPGDDPNSQDWGWVMCTDNDVADEDDLCRTLHKYNGTYTTDNGKERGHILVFDDADKLLTTSAKKMIAIMKKINDGNPKARIFTNPDTGENEVWQGRIIIMTNKSLDKISTDEDKKAILSRGTKSDIQFTRNETMELLRTRYKTMTLPEGIEERMDEEKWTPEDRANFRQDIFDFMQEHVTDADPAKFTPRAFIQLVNNVAPKWKNGSKARKAGRITIGTNVPWEVAALSIIKAESNEIEKAILDELNKAESEDVEAQTDNKKKPKKASKKNADAFIFGDINDPHAGKGDTNGYDIDSNSEDDEDDEKNEDETAEKGFDSEFGMSLTDAESLLLD